MGIDERIKEKESTAPFSKILVAADNSEYASRAFDYAAKLSRLTGARISIVHVISPPVAAEGISFAELAELQKKEGEQLLAKLKVRAEMQFGIKAEGILEKGNPSKVILTTAKDTGADLIVVGSSGIGGVKELLLGSVSHTVSNHATCPVLIVK
jgi:nucleotide-binding universal stress UspA family protein